MVFPFRLYVKGGRLLNDVIEEQYGEKPYKRYFATHENITPFYTDRKSLEHLYQYDDKSCETTHENSNDKNDYAKYGENKDYIIIRNDENNDENELMHKDDNDEMNEENDYSKYGENEDYIIIRKDNEEMNNEMNNEMNKENDYSKYGEKELRPSVGSAYEETPTLGPYGEIYEDNDPSAFQQKLENESIPFNTSYEIIHSLPLYGIFPLSFMCSESTSTRAVLTVQLETMHGMFFADYISKKTSLIAIPLLTKDNPGDSRIVIDVSNDKWSAVPLTITKHQNHMLCPEDDTIAISIIDPYWGRTDEFIKTIKQCLKPSVGYASQMHVDGKINSSSKHMYALLALQSSLNSGALTSRGISILNDIHSYDVVPLHTLVGDSIYQRAVVSCVAPMNHAVSICDMINTHDGMIAFVVQREEENAFGVPVAENTRAYTALSDDVYQRKVNSFCRSEDGCSLIMCVDAIWGHRVDSYSGLLDCLYTAVQKTLPEPKISGGTPNLGFNATIAHNMLSRRESQDLITIAKKEELSDFDKDFMNDIIERFDASNLEIVEFEPDSTFFSEKCKKENCPLDDTDTIIIYLSTPEKSGGSILFHDSKQIVQPRSGTMIQSNGESHTDAYIPEKTYAVLLRV